MKMMRFAMIALILMGSAVQATELKILSGNGGRAAVSELSACFEKETGI